MPGSTLYQFDHNVEMEVHDCPTCGMPYAAPAYFFKRVRNGKEGDSWYCPRGHSIVFRHSKVEELQEKLEAERRGKKFAQRQAELQSVI